MHCLRLVPVLPACDATYPPARTPPAQTSKTKPAPGDEFTDEVNGQVTDTGVDEAVLKEVDDERQAEPGGDLLSSNGEDELGVRPVA